MISSWSHSRVIEFEKCKYRAFLLHDQRVPEPQRPLPPGKTEHANDRGTRVHQGCEDYVKGVVPNPPPEAAEHFAEEMARMRELYAHGVVSLEGEWGMNRNWEPWNWQGQWVETTIEDSPGDWMPMKVKVLPEKPKAGDTYQIGKKIFIWEPAWMRLKLDALVFESPEKAIAIDYKTGKKFGNEIKHGEQLQLYQLVTFLRYPKLEEVTTELWYLDVDEITPAKFTRSQGLRFQKSWDKRGNALTSAVEFPPNPNVHSCKWCMYGPWGSGDCTVGRK